MKKLRNIFNSISKNSLLLILVLGLTSSLAAFTAVRLTGNQQANASNCDVVCVSLKADGMYPNELAVKRGQIVQFNSADGKNHNISEGNGSHGHDDEHEHEHVGDYLSGEFGPDEAWRVQFKEVGTYKLHDHYNPKQSILVVVYDER